MIDTDETINLTNITFNPPSKRENIQICYCYQCGHKIMSYGLVITKYSNYCDACIEEKKEIRNNRINI